jgi:hypothetical protein
MCCGKHKAPIRFSDERDAVRQQPNPALALAAGSSTSGKTPERMVARRQACAWRQGGRGRGSRGAGFYTSRRRHGAMKGVRSSLGGGGPKICLFIASGSAVKNEGLYHGRSKNLRNTNDDTATRTRGAH